MNKWRILYWFGSAITDCYVKASNEADAIQKFRAQHGDDVTISKVYMVDAD